MSISGYLSLVFSFHKANCLQVQSRLIAPYPIKMRSPECLKSGKIQKFKRDVIYCHREVTARFF